MLDYSDLRFTLELEEIISDLAISNDYDMIMFLEQYKFYSRDELVEFLKEKTGDTYVIVDSVNRNRDYTDLERRCGVIISDAGKMAVEVIATVGSSIDISILELKFGNASVSEIYVTPQNFSELCGMALPEVDPIIMFKRILLEAVGLGATDIHFDVKHTDAAPDYTVSIRKNGDLLPLNLFILTAELNKRIISALIERKTSNSSMDLSNSSGVVASSSGLFKSSDIELRISANKALNGHHYVVRIQQKTTFSFTIDRLGFTKSVQTALHHVVEKRSGITLITGAIRTGKNTTAFALANEMVKEPIKIVSYESPIEVLMPFTQVDYHEDPNVLANAVRLAKKQDVNAAFINEIPNKEVAFAAQDLVNSSVHVITTMHMNRVWHLPYKLKEYYGDGFKDVLSQINAVFNQKMFGVPCKHCQDIIRADSLNDARHRKIFAEHGVLAVKASHGCAYCDGTGIQPGTNQPYVEFVEFDDSLVSELLRCHDAYDMEVILRDKVAGSNLENSIVKAISEGNLPLMALSYVI